MVTKNDVWVKFEFFNSKIYTDELDRNIICFVISIFKLKFRNIRFDLNIVVTALMVDREIKEKVKKNENT